MNYSITVIIPTYNSSSYIEKPILSVAKQSYSVKKIIIVDDNSEDIDELKVKLETLKKKLFSNIELIQNKENLGPGQSRNNAWKKCETNLIAFLDDDDYWVKDKIENQLKIFEKYKDVSLVSSKKLFTIKNTISLRKISKIKKINFFSLIFKNYISTSTVILKTSIKHRFLNARYAEDYFLWLSITKDKDNCYFINEYMCEELDIKKDIKLSKNQVEIKKNINKILSTFYNDNISNNLIIFIAKIYNNFKINIKIIFKLS
jgi:teichuronic acid biosynthesis glycosyltransferase TuaG